MRTMSSIHRRLQPLSSLPLPPYLARRAAIKKNSTTMSTSSILLVVSLLISCFTSSLHAETVRMDSRNLRIVNQAGHRIDVYWINRWDNDALSLSTAEGGILFGTETGINSFIGHEFEVQELPSKKTGVCGGEGGVCRKGHFQVNANDDQLITVYPNLKIVHEDNKSRARDQAKKILQACKAQMEQNATIQALPMDERMQALAHCMESNVNATLQELQEEIDFQSKVRNQIGSRLGNYACQDVNFTATESKENKTWTFESKVHPLRVYHDRASSLVAVVEHFATPQQCQAVLEQAAKADGGRGLQYVDGANGLFANKGSVKLDPTILAQQTKGGFFKSEDPLHGLVRKMYSFANDYLKIGDADLAPLAVQEDLFVLHYAAAAPDSDAATKHRYEPHCDGPCKGGDYQPGERIATMIIYCDVPAKGGATHFSQTGIHIKPEVGSALFFSYLDPATMEVDTGFSEHQGCQVFEGDKRIISHKFRSGILPKDDEVKEGKVADEQKKEL